MSRKLLSAVFSLGLLALSTSNAYTQDSEVIVKQGDRIEWFALSAGPHGVRFGADGATPPINEVNALLEFDPPGLVTGGTDSQEKTTGRLLTAKVKANAEVGKRFVFICSVHSGANGPMVSHPFRIAASVQGEQARTHKIAGVTGLHWAIVVDTSPPPPPN